MRIPLSLTGPRDIPLSPGGPSQLVDSFGRVHNNLRISVTDRCNLRCTYCMPEEVVFRDKSELLSFEEIVLFVQSVVPLGINKIRLTGGEPLLRRDLPLLVRMLTKMPALRDIGLTTNGLLLSQQAAALREAGLTRINVSLDSLDAERFRTLARRDGLPAVLDGLDAAWRLGFRVKVNAVAIRGFIEQDVLPLAAYCRERGFELRFIEYMPIGAEQWERDKVVTAEELRQQLHEVWPLRRADHHDPRHPAVDYDYVDGQGRVGFIASVSRPFCHRCNRVRLTADGKLRNCLFALDEVDVKPLLRGDFNPDAIQQLVRHAVWQKWEGHEFNSARFVKPQRTMHSIGG